MAGKKTKKVQKCPICGAERPEYEFVTIKDGILCYECAEKLVVAHPVSYYKNPKYNVYTVRQKKGFLSSEYEDVLESNGQPYSLRSYAGMNEIMLSEYQGRLNSLNRVRDELCRRFQAKAAFSIMGGFPLLAISPFEIGIVAAKKYKNAYLYVGRCIVGSFLMNEEVILIHQGRPYKSSVLGASEIDEEIDIARMERYYNEKENGYRKTTYSWWKGLDAFHLTEGHPGELILAKETPIPTPGDYILKL